MSTFDVVIGLTKKALDAGIAQLHANAGAREKLFKGKLEGKVVEESFVATWEVQAAPTFTLAPPPVDKWAASRDASGKPPSPNDRPTSDSFQLTFPKFQADFTLERDPPISGTTLVDVFVKVALAGNKLSLTPLSIWLDESTMSRWDKLILNQVRKQVLAKAQAMLASIDVPPLSFTQLGTSIQLTPPLVKIEGERLLLAASLASKGKVDISGFAWPADKPLFVLLSADMIQTVAAGAGSSPEIKGKSISDKGSRSVEELMKNLGLDPTLANLADVLAGPLGVAAKAVLELTRLALATRFFYDYKATINGVKSIVPRATDLTKIDAVVNLSVDAQLSDSPDPPGKGPCAVETAFDKLQPKKGG